MSYVKRRRVLTEGHVRRTVVVEGEAGKDYAHPKVRKLNAQEQKWAQEWHAKDKGDQRGDFKLGQEVTYKGKALYVGDAVAEQHAPGGTLYTLYTKDFTTAYDNVPISEIKGKKSTGRAKRKTPKGLAGKPFRMF